MDDMLVMHTLSNANKVAAKILGKCYNFKCLTHGFYQFNYLETFTDVSAGSQPYACKFYRRSDDSKVLKFAI